MYAPRQLDITAKISYRNDTAAGQPLLIPSARVLAQRENGVSTLLVRSIPEPSQTVQIPPSVSTPTPQHVSQSRWAGRPLSSSNRSEKGTGLAVFDRNHSAER